MDEMDVLDCPIESEETIDTVGDPVLRSQVEQQGTMQSDDQMLERYFEKLSSEADPEVALLGRVNGEFMKSFFGLGKMIESMGDDCHTDVEHLSVFLRGNAMKLELGRMIGRIAQMRFVLNNTSKPVARLGRS